ncbi:hypothetical protein PHMEG_00040719 [Phytophthora megakarya]|uniref:Uncharacterized protein n=1 Tax=Phytophthora megakarya TaxID=4795 RepID=A0A225UD91_9STRA|nr:hypothetical protein PHMEG_00040719 [Phytophthora megakarya]
MASRVPRHKSPRPSGLPGVGVGVPGVASIGVGGPGYGYGAEPAISVGVPGLASVGVGLGNGGVNVGANVLGLGANVGVGVPGVVGVNPSVGVNGARSVVNGAPSVGYSIVPSVNAGLHHQDYLGNE